MPRNIVQLITNLSIYICISQTLFSTIFFTETRKRNIFSFINTISKVCETDWMRLKYNMEEQNN